MAVLDLVARFCRRTGIPVPSAAVGSTDDQVLQVVALLEEEGNDLAGRGQWEALTREATHTTLAAEDQGAVTTIAASGFRYIKNGTFYDRTDDVPVIGPLSPDEWQNAKAMTWTGPRYSFRIRGGKLLVTPTPAAGHTWAFEYISKYWILGVDGTTYKQYFTLDTDTLLLSEDLLMMGLRWRWKKEKGQEYAEDFRAYEAQVADALGRDGGKAPLHAGGEGYQGARPGIFVPQGSWSL